VPHPGRNIRTFRCERTTCRGYRVPVRGRWGHGSHARQPRRREAARVACPAWRPDPARCLGPGHWRPCRVAGLCRVAGPPAAGLPLRQAAAGLGPDMRQRGVRCPAARTGGRHRNLQTLTRCHLRTRAKKATCRVGGLSGPEADERVERLCEGRPPDRDLHRGTGADVHGTLAAERLARDPGVSRAVYQAGAGMLWLCVGPAPPSAGARLRQAAREGP
jgi:hypothetical protein